METEVYVRDAADPRKVARAVEDLAGGWRQRRLAWALAWLDTRNRYRGSVFGPFWLTFSTAVMVGGLGVLYSTLFKLDIRLYLPFLAVSLLLWNTINQIAAEACTTFTSADAIIRQMRLPYTVHILRTVFRTLISAAHSLPLIALVFLVCGHLPGPEAFLVVPGFIILIVNAIAGAFFLGLLCARFRDIPPIVANVMQLAFFLSPILWKPELLEGWQAWLFLNPFYVLIEVVRGPLVEGGVPLRVWAASVVYTSGMVALALVFFVRFRNRLAFWI
ncbi:ABC transporter permease [Sabulicella rubraurantiaca]|uniref:ABC transporter permease n=1 Tax=Sabulicella rubraurantiaca TaxID=2811429 RepID=UPI001F3CDB39|nr:ABC transporter permease [Sabulicella rubraurantiaca]